MKHTFHTIWIQLDPLFQFEPKLGVGHQSSILEVLSLASIKNFTNSIIQALDMVLLIRSLFLSLFLFYMCMEKSGRLVLNQGSDFLGVI